jgi:hypothetical protein
MPKWQRMSLGWSALIASCLLMLVSILANMKFAESLGATEFDKKLLMAAGVGSDLLKMAIPLAFLLFLRRKAWVPLGATVAVGAVVIAFSLMAAIGFVAGERLANYDRVTQQVAQTKRTTDKINRLERNRDWAQVTKPVSVLEAELKAKYAEPDYRAAGFCNTAKGDKQVALCRSIAELGVQITAAKALEDQDKAVDQMQADLTKNGRTYGDAQVETLAALTGSSKGWLMVMIALGVLLIEFGSTFGPTIALGLLMADTTSSLGRTVGQAFGRLPVVQGSIAPITAPDPAEVEKEVKRQQRLREGRLNAQGAANFPKPAPVRTGGGLADLLTPIPSRTVAKSEVA